MARALFRTPHVPTTVGFSLCLAAGSRRQGTGHFPTLCVAAPTGLGTPDVRLADAPPLSSACPLVPTRGAPGSGHGRCPSPGNGDPRPHGPQSAALPRRAHTS